MSDERRLLGRALASRRGTAYQWSGGPSADIDAICRSPAGHPGDTYDYVSLPDGTTNERGPLSDQILAPLNGSGDNILENLTEVDGVDSA
jgi:hypothetical protein